MEAYRLVRLNFDKDVRIEVKVYRFVQLDFQTWNLSPERTRIACLTLERKCKDESVPESLVQPSEDIQTEMYRFARLNFQVEGESQ